MNKELLKEWAVFLIIFTGLLFPLRFIFNNYLQHYWFGSLGILSIVTFILFFLSTKGKLGYVGYVIKKRIIKIPKGKAFKAYLISASILIYITGLTITGIIVADKQITTTFVNQMTQQHITTVKQITSEGYTNVQNNPSILPIDILIILTPNPLMFQISDIMNQITHGYGYTICSLVFVEQIELLGINLFFKYRFKESS